MFSIFLRRLQRFLPVIKILAVIFSAAGLFFLIFFTSPELINIIAASISLAIFTLVVLSVFLNSRLAFLIATGLSFIFFLKAEDLLSPLNLGVFVVFIALLAFYLRPDNPRRTIKKE